MEKVHLNHHTMLILGLIFILLFNSASTGPAPLPPNNTDPAAAILVRGNDSTTTADGTTDSIQYKLICNNADNSHVIRVCGYNSRGTFTMLTVGDCYRYCKCSSLGAMTCNCLGTCTGLDVKVACMKAQEGNGGGDCYCHRVNKERRDGEDRGVEGSVEAAALDEREDDAAVCKA